MKYYKIFKIILIIIPIFILVILFYKDFNPRGYLKVDYDFCREDPFVSKFSPQGRVLDIQKNRGECSQEMIIDPVYFDVRLPQKFNSARLKIWYKKNPQTLLKIGPAQNLSTWQWQLKDIPDLGYPKSGMSSRTGIDGWQIGSANYDLSNIQLDKNNLRFIISSPGLDSSGEQIIFNKIEIEFLKGPLSAANWKQRIKEWLVSFKFNW